MLIRVKEKGWNKKNRKNKEREQNDREREKMKKIAKILRNCLFDHNSSVEVGYGLCYS